jgi:hypothetical protein
MSTNTHYVLSIQNCIDLYQEVVCTTEKLYILTVYIHYTSQLFTSHEYKYSLLSIQNCIDLYQEVVHTDFNIISSAPFI